MKIKELRAIGKKNFVIGNYVGAWFRGNLKTNILRLLYKV